MNFTTQICRKILIEFLVLLKKYVYNSQEDVSHVPTQWIGTLQGDQLLKGNVILKKVDAEEGVYILVASLRMWVTVYTDSKGNVII